MILPGTLRLSNLQGEPLREQDYTIDYQTSSIFFHQATSDTLQAHFFIHPQKPVGVQYPRNPSLILSGTPQTVVPTRISSPTAPKPFEGLNSQGAFLRGLTFGNNQGSSMQSSLNLNLSGNLSENIGILASISDTNMPIEADGYAQNLEQFDRVFVELFTDNSRLRAGHVDLVQSGNFFGNFQRKVTGLQLAHRWESENHTTEFHQAGSVSRGEFVLHRFQAQDGNQGPYRLRGNHNEAYIIILSGSERIYLDGILLKRGEDLDYVMNYNTGEITFTQKHLMRSTHRIVAEYSYTNRNYNRFLVYGGVSQQREKINWSAHWYSEADNKLSPVNQNLSDEEIEILTNAGNNRELMVTTAAQAAPYDPDKIQYIRVFQDGMEVFIFSEDADAQLYDVFFSQVPQNTGDYILSGAGNNRRIFEYVPRINGVPQGNFQPIRNIIPPQKHQLLTTNAEMKWGENGKILADLALSNNDVNTFSAIDNTQNLGTAVRLAVQNSWQRGNWAIIPTLQYSFVQHNFRALERLRIPEFARDFNLPQEIGLSNQHFFESNISMALRDSLIVNYGFDYLNFVGQYRGAKQKLNTYFGSENYLVRADIAYLNSEASYQNTNFVQYGSEAVRRLGNWELRAGSAGENNQIRQIQFARDSGSFHWNESFVAAQIGDSLQRYAMLKLYRRVDDSARLDLRRDRVQILGAIFNSRWLKTENSALQTLLHYRNVQHSDSLRADNLLNVGIDFNQSMFKNAAYFNLSYNLSGGVELQRAFTYVRVADGMGIYRWTDYNGDGVEQMDEFEIAEFSDLANYIRVFTNSVDQVGINRSGFSALLRLQPYLYFTNSNFWKRWDANFSYNTTATHLKQDRLSQWSPWSHMDQVRNQSTQYIMQLHYGKSGSYKFSMSEEISGQTNTRFVFTGLESNKLFQQKLTGRYSLSNQWIVESLHLYQLNESDAEAFANRRYQILRKAFEQKIIYRTQTLTAFASGVLGSSRNKLGDEKLNDWQINSELQWNTNRDMSVMANVSYVNNQFTGDSFSLVANQMMEGLRQGSNLVWSLLLQRRIGADMEVNVQYSGRKNEAFPAIHTGNVQVRYNF